MIDNTQAPSYKIAKFLNNRLKDYINLPGTYTTKNSYEIAQELHNTHIRENHKIITLDIKDLCVNLPIKGIIQTTKFWLDKISVSKTISEHILHLLQVIIEQNYFQYNNQFFRPDKSIAMGSPISGTLAEIYQQFMEETYIKQWIENQEIIYYKRYVDDILIIFDQNKISETAIIIYMNNINPLNPELNPICYLLALLGAYHFLHVSRIKVKLLTFRLLMSYIYGTPILDVSRSRTTTQHSR